MADTGSGSDGEKTEGDLLPARGLLDMPVDLIETLGGFQEGELTVLAARPGIGKTALAMHIAPRAVLRERKAVAYFALDMPAGRLVQRALASEARVDMAAMRADKLTAEESQRLEAATSQLWGTPLYVDDSSALTMRELVTKARSLKEKDASLALIVVDYLQLLSSTASGPSELTRELRAAAKELRVSILALSQLGRTSGHARPQLADVRELEQDADVIAFLHPAAKASGAAGSAANVDLIVAKNRNGPIGTERLRYFPDSGRFEGAAKG